ncbi:DMT family transporter [Bacteroidota bacterium]
MLANHYGEFAALLTAMFWTVTALAFESATKKVGSIPVNIIRLCFAFVFLSALNLIFRGHPFPYDASQHAWIWLSLSGLVGFVLGDYFLFKSYPLVGSRVAMLMMTLVPPITAIIGWLVLGETMKFTHIVGMGMVISGIALAILSRNVNGKRMSLNQPVRGLLYAFGGAIGQAVGLVLSKYGMRDYDAFAATQIRVIAGIIGFVIVITLLKRWPNIKSALTDKSAMKGITTGSFFGPFLGVSFSLVAIQYTTTGIASTIMAIVPVLIIAPAILIYKQKVTMKEVIGAVISVAGVALLFF